MSGRDDDDELVYSTERGRIRPPPGGKKDRKKRGKPRPQAVPHSGRGVRVARATKGRKGKGVTVVTGLDLDPFELKELARTLKARCGAGGAVRDGTIEIQGEHRDEVVAALKSMGYDAKKSGG